MFEAYIGALWGETRDTMSELHPAVRANRRDSLEAWLAGVFSPKVFPDVGVDRHGTLFGVEEAWRQSRLMKVGSGRHWAEGAGFKGAQNTQGAQDWLASQAENSTRPVITGCRGPEHQGRLGVG
jgi:hypothetical protein